MIGNTMVFTINVMGDAQNVVNNIEQSFTGLNNAVKKSTSIFDKFADISFKTNQITSAVQGLQQSFNNAIQPGVKLDSALADLSAITGETGEGLKKIEEYARKTAKTFGIDAAQGVESYKLILSQLSPEIAKVPEALSGMGTHIATLSKTMGGDVTAAAEVLTTAMNQYQVSLDDPISATKVMGDMMNVMASAAKLGSAELPQIKEALKQAGMTAKMAGVSFEETNAAIQVLDKAGKKGAEGGVALRNVMATLGQGRFLPPAVLEELQSANIDVSVLTNTSLTLEERLKVLKPVMKDGALMTKLFGRENQAAAMALISGTEQMAEWTDSIKGTNTAQEQAKIIMESYAERLARVQARFDDLKISLFNATGDFGIWFQIVSSSLIPVAQLIPLVAGVGQMFAWIKTIQFAGVMTNIGHSITGARISLAFMNRDLITGQMVNLGFMANVVRSTLALARFATVGIWSAIKGIGAYILSLVTGGAMSATFAAVSSASFATFALTASAACKAVSVAIFSIPIIGWIALAVTAIGTLFVYLYKKVDGFRAVMNGIGAAIKALFTGESVSEAYNNAYNNTLDEAARKRAEEADKEEAERLGMSVGDYQRVSKEAKGKGVGIDEYLAQNPAARLGIAPTGAPILDANGVPETIQQNTEAAVTGGTRNTNITMNVGNMVESITFTENLKSSAKELEQIVFNQITKALLAAQSVG